MSNRFTFCFCTGLIPKEALWYAQAANIPMIVIGKFIQVKDMADKTLHFTKKVKIYGFFS